MSSSAIITSILRWANVCTAALLLHLCTPACTQGVPRIISNSGGLSYSKDSLGNSVPDFSFAGYKSSDETIPEVPILLVVSHEEGDQTSRIQRAIDYVGSLQINEKGFRGTILLAPGIFEIQEGLILDKSGVVLRGSGLDKTTILGVGLDRTTVISVAGEDQIEVFDKISIVDNYVPVGSLEFSIDDASQLKVGDEITISRPSTQQWIDDLGMNDFGGETGYIGWKPNERNIVWNRIIKSISGNKISIDAPITTALESRYGGGFINKVINKGRIENIGIENLRLSSTFDSKNPKDEQHRWMAITLENVRDAWVRQVQFEHFAGSAVAIWNTSSRITVEDCLSLDPISEIGGQRRYTFFTEGQQCLFQRLYSEYGYHDFGVGFMAAGPNAFVQCEAFQPASFSGTIDSWASGVLFDIVNVDGNALRFGNRGMEAQGAGWTAANSMFWQCSAALIECSAPLGTMNYAYATWSQSAGNGQWNETNGFLKPRSLFYGQLAHRNGGKVSTTAHLLPMQMEATSSPTIDQAKAYAAEANNSPQTLKDWITKADQRLPISINGSKAKKVDKIKSTSLSQKEEVENTLNLTSGRLLFGNKLATGNRRSVQWWRGNDREYDAIKAGPHVTRFVPGRSGVGHTDFIDETVSTLKSQNVVALDHNYGLWYDRRRDDHQRIRRMNGEAWAPFYEQPFARSGQDLAWDGMSKYDLTSYNYWYWNRLRDFVNQAERNQLVLYHQNYFQHNILEAGGHYADFPWRTANNINNTPFPEPVNYAGDKRIFMAEQFYDVSDPDYRSLHERYIRKCLNNFKGQSNVIQFTSAEYTGPLSFITFWLDVIGDWEKETGADVKVALSATKDVQDAILKDKNRAQLVDVIDIRYWWYGEAKDGSVELYAPEGGVNLAPRQHARLTRTPKETFETTYAAVLEYRSAYPNKAVIVNTNRSSDFGWAVFMAGGSLMNIPIIPDQDFLKDASLMTPEKGNTAYQLINESSGERILYNQSSSAVSIDLRNYSGNYEIKWINPKTGDKLSQTTSLQGGKINEIKTEAEILWLDKN